MGSLNPKWNVAAVISGAFLLAWPAAAAGAEASHSALAVHITVTTACSFTSTPSSVPFGFRRSPVRSSSGFSSCSGGARPRAEVRTGASGRFSAGMRRIAGTNPVFVTISY